MIKFNNINWNVYKSSENNAGILSKEFMLCQIYSVSINSDMLNEFDMPGITTIHRKIDNILGKKVKAILTQVSFKPEDIIANLMWVNCPVELIFTNYQQ
ncbi:MAG: hypothetical protein ACK4G1_01170 [Ignavibacteria bacterium]